MTTTDVQQTADEETRHAEIQRLTDERERLKRRRQRLLSEIARINVEQAEVDQRLYEIASNSRQ